MISQLRYPKTALKDSIDAFYFNYADNFEVKLVNPPLLNQEIVFNLGDLMEVSDFQNRYTTKNLTTWISGLHSVPTQTTLKGKHLSIGVLFKPWGLYQMFGISPSYFTNTAIDSTIILGSPMEDFVRNKINYFSPEIFLEVFESYLFKSYKPKNINKSVIHSINTLESIEKQKGSFQRLANELNMSSKSFINIFNKTVGLTPTKYLNLKRICHAVEIIKKYPHKQLTEIGYDLGFFDQAHFIRVFKLFCGVSPKIYKKELKIFG